MKDRMFKCIICFGRCRIEACCPKCETTGKNNPQALCAITMTEQLSGCVAATVGRGLSLIYSCVWRDNSGADVHLLKNVTVVLDNWDNILPLCNFILKLRLSSLHWQCKWQFRSSDCWLKVLRAQKKIIQRAAGWYEENLIWRYFLAISRYTKYITKCLNNLPIRLYIYTDAQRSVPGRNFPVGRGWLMMH